MAAFRGELNRALTRVLQLSYQRPMKWHLAHTVWKERCLIKRLSEKKIKLEYRYAKEDPKVVLVRLFEQGNAVCSFELMQLASTMSPCKVII